MSTRGRRRHPVHDRPEDQSRRGDQGGRRHQALVLRQKGMGCQGVEEVDLLGHANTHRAHQEGRPHYPRAVTAISVSDDLGSLTRPRSRKRKLCSPLRVARKRPPEAGNAPPRRRSRCLEKNTASRCQDRRHTTSSRSIPLSPHPSPPPPAGGETTKHRTPIPCIPSRHT